MNPKKDVTESIYYKLAGQIGHIIFLQLMFIICIFPILVSFLFVRYEINNFIFMTPLFFLAVPALAALSSSTLYILESQDVKHLGIYFWKQYRKLFLDALKIGIPVIFATSIILIDIASMQKSSTPIFSWFFILLLLVLLVFTVFVGLINIKFKFRIRDMFKISMVWSMTFPSSVIKVIILSLGLLGIMFFVSGFLIFVLTSTYIYLICHELSKMLDWVWKNYTQEGKSNTEL
ncbi:MULTISPECIES: DUF624 domain-containing protein [Lactococcus]|uniref:DUF624 domain-containing protein n=1 Tax=Lactococcus TaxID=1357 RepID=UPI0014316BC3|nr:MULTISPECIES: DUF624 domain-containing protein [Lactococcus]KAF6608249.1 DUF624 domain-containing protein [Lactococcus sp. EKM201L]KAF6612117.1 DUF624 domain-containing protein [Lactococcus sp. EKM203L]KAF6640557.1 DUF624 domain-containing protein [Lactococcus sp. EKM501L]KAF6643493.1 DUF624 domain-containing protein [Lactococcus sp. EKM502L]KAF6651334.1 DUF624 domain-containing protein [Lactococcus sp. EKM101L]